MTNDTTEKQKTSLNVRHYPSVTWYNPMNKSHEFTSNSVHNISHLLEYMERGETIIIERINTDCYMQVGFWKDNTLLYMSHPQGITDWKAILEVKNRKGYTGELVHPDVWRWTVEAV
jgi:hypothetical protein